PSLGPLNAHHLLIVPRTHYLSFAAIVSKSSLQQLTEIKTKLIQYNQSQFSLSTAFFEHGTGAQSDVACACIEHAHLHVLGTHIDLHSQLTSHYQFLPTIVQSIHGSNTLAATGYYFYEHTESGALISTQHLEPQFFRIMFWHAFGDWSPWNWRL